MVFKDLESLADVYSLILTESKKTNKPDKDKDGVPDWADKHPGKDDRKPSKKKKASKSMMKEDELTFKSLYNKILNEKR
jgi:hypothetical protein